MNYLQIAQTVANESGVVPSAAPPGHASAKPGTVAGATGLELKILGWVGQAWRDVQVSREDWRWMLRECLQPLVVGEQRYSAVDLDAPRFGSWRPYDSDMRSTFTLYDPALGLDHEGFLTYVMSWDSFNRYRLRGTPHQAMPGEYSIDPDRNIVFNCEPDKAYICRGQYRLLPQVLTVDADTPEMPEQFHDLIVYKALLKAEAYDESPNRFQYWQAEADRMMAALVQDQTEPFFQHHRYLIA